MDPRHGQSASELKLQLELSRQGQAFVVYRNGEGRALTHALSPSGTTIGRGDADIPLAWDSEVSRLHCEIRRIGDSWVIVDDGLSRNGTFVNGSRVVGRLRLAEHDQIKIGAVDIAFSDPASSEADETAIAADSSAPDLTSTQRNVLIALCRPLALGRPGQMPASNNEIAEELHLTVPGVKSQLRTLFARFQIEDLAQNEKRASLAARAIESGAISFSDLSPK